MTSTARSALIKMRGLVALREQNERTLKMAISEVNDFGLVPTALAEQYLDGVRQYVTGSASVIDDFDTLMAEHLTSEPNPELDAVMGEIATARDSMVGLRAEAESHYKMFTAAIEEFGLTPAEALAVVLNANPDHFSSNSRKGL